MKQAGRKKIRKRIRNVALLLGITVVGVWATGLFYARPALESKIKTAFAKATGNRYTLTFDHFELSYRSGGISIENLKIKPNPDSLGALRDNGLLELTCSEASIHGIRFWKTFFGNRFAAEELLLETPVLTMWNKNGIKSETVTGPKRKHIGELNLDKIRINNAQAVIRDKNSDRFLFGTRTLNLFVDDFGLTEDLLPVYRHFTLEAFENSLSLFGDKQFKLEKLFLTGGSEYTGLNAAGFDISEIDSSLHKALRIPPEITFSLGGISVESESLTNLVEQIVQGRTENIFISKLLLIQPQVSIGTTRSLKEKKNTAPSDKINSLITQLALPSVDQVGILNGHFTWRETGVQKTVLDISGINVMATGLRPRINEKIPVIFSTAEISTGKTAFSYPGFDYSLYLDAMQYRSVTDSLKIAGFRFTPNLKDLDSFYMDKKWRIDRFDFASDSILVQDLHLADFVLHNRFEPVQIRFISPDLQVHTDKRLQHDPNFTKPFPLQKLRSISGYFNIGEISFENGTATYSEKVPKSPGWGSLKMTEANLTLRNVKSHPVPTDTARLDYNCSFGEESYGEISLDIPLYGRDEIQYGHGMIKKLPFKLLNSITENTVFMGFGGGELDSCWFSFKGLNGKADGRSVFYYNNLKVKIYKVVEVPSYKTMVLFNKTFMTLAANLLINKNNPTEKGYSMPGKLEFERDKLKGPLNFWIRTIMTGLMNTVVDDISELKDLQEEIKSLKSSSQTGLLSKMKANPAKKNARKQAREEQEIRSGDGMK